MAEWWEAAPVVQKSDAAKSDDWWSSVPLAGASQEPPPVLQDGSVSADNASRAFATGVPVIGGLLNRMDAATNATLAPLIDPLLPDSFQKLPGQTWEERYNQALGIQTGKDQAFAEQSPVASTALNVAGGVAGTVPMIMAAPTLMGAGGGSLLARTGASTVSGATLGGTDSVIRSDLDPNQSLWGTGIGAATGLIGPFAGQAVGSGVRKVVDALTRRGAASGAGMTSGALNQLTKAANADGLDAATMQTRLADLGPEAMIMDLGPNLQSQAGALAASPGRPQEILRGAVNSRQAGANQRILGELDQTLGPVQSPVQLNEGIQAGQRATGPAYGESFANAMPVQTDYIADALDHQARTLRGPAQRAAQQVRGMLNQVGTDVLDTNPYTLFQTRNAIDGMMAGEQNPQVMRVLTQARQQIDENLSRNVPGIKMADAQYEELARQNEGLRRGGQILDSGKTSPRPEDLANEVVAGVEPNGLMIGPSGETFRMSQGARAEIDRIVGTKANDIVGLNQVVKGDGDWNRSKLANLFGQDKADRIIAVLDREKAFADTRHIVDRNSETARRMAAMADLTPSQGGQFGPRQAFEAGGVSGAGRSLVLRGVDKIAGAMAGANAEARNISLAEAISSNRQKVIDALAKTQQTSKLPTKQIDQITRALLLSGGLSAGR